MSERIWTTVRTSKPQGSGYTLCVPLLGCGQSGTNTTFSGMDTTFDLCGSYLLILLRVRPGKSPSLYAYERTALAVSAGRVVGVTVESQSGGVISKQL